MTIAAECPCRPRVFVAMEWSWLEPGWEEKDAVHIQIPPSFRPTESGPKKFEPTAFVGRRGVQILKQFKAKQGEPKGRIWPYTPEWFIVTPSRIYQRAVAEQAIRASGPAEQPITLKSFRKYVFNAIDAARDISPEWRAMLKGRELGVEKYYSKENIEKLREVYMSKIYPSIWKAEVRELTRLDRLRQQLEDWGYKPDEILREEGVKKLASARKAIKHGGPRIWQFEYEWTDKEKEEILQEYIQDILESGGRGFRKSTANGGKPFESRIISEDELTGYLDEGWDLVKELSNGKIVVRRPLDTRFP